MGPRVVCQQSFFYPLGASRGGARRLHRRVPLLRPPRQRLSAELAHALHDRVLGFVAGVERAGAIFHLVEECGHLFIQLRMAL
jgi:hypothetical protein